MLPLLLWLILDLFTVLLLSPVTVNTWIWKEEQNPQSIIFLTLRLLCSCRFQSLGGSLQILLYSVCSVLTQFFTLFPFLLFSRFTSPCTLIISSLPLCQKYVQDVLREHLSEMVYQCLRQEGGHIYVCGDVTMAGDVLKTVQQIIKQQGNMSLEDAGFFISKLRVRVAKFSLEYHPCYVHVHAPLYPTKLNVREILELVKIPDQLWKY